MGRHEASTGRVQSAPPGPAKRSEYPSTETAKGGPTALLMLNASLCDGKAREMKFLTVEDAVYSSSIGQDKTIL